MAKDQLPDRALADKLYKTKYEPDSAHSHIEVKKEECKVCAEKACLHFCPAEVYKADPNDPGAVLVSHDNCLECGTCRRQCPKGAVMWRYPEGGAGVKYRYG